MMVVTTQISIQREGHPVTFCQHCRATSTSDLVEDAANSFHVDISSLLEMLGSVPDPRDPRGTRYAISFVLAVCVVATLAGARNYAEIARRARDMPQVLLKKLGAKWDWFKFRYQLPGVSVMHSVLTRVSAEELDLITGRWLFLCAEKNEKDEWEIAIDGKVLRGAWTDENDQVTLLSAMIHREAITVAQLRVPGDTNEITQVGELLKAIEVPEGNSVLVTVDAAHTQHETAEEIHENGMDYLMRVKGNQPTLQRTVFDKVLPLLQEHPHSFVLEHARGRIRIWSCWITGADAIEFPHASQAGFIRREVFEISGTRLSKDEALMLTSRTAEEMTAEDMNRHARGHWGIENNSHYVRDTVYREDHCQAWEGEGPQTLASLRNLAIGLLRLKGVRAIKETTELIAADRMRALQFMTT
jgi:predicted transposase YbfD/YdcC